MAWRSMGRPGRNVPSLQPLAIPHPAIQEISSQKGCAAGTSLKAGSVHGLSGGLKGQAR